MTAWAPGKRWWPRSPQPWSPVNRRTRSPSLPTSQVAIAKPGLAEITREELLQLQEQRNAPAGSAQNPSPCRVRAVVADVKNQAGASSGPTGVSTLCMSAISSIWKKARSLGDLLVVGLNSDASVRSFKGPDRPIVEEKQRAKLLSALSCVDYVIIFADTSPIKLIAELQPGHLCQGRRLSYRVHQSEERRLVENYGGRIVLLPGVPGMSTSHLIDKIIKTYR